MEEQIDNRPIKDQEGEIDIIALVRKVWDGRKTVYISTAVCAVLGVFIALFSAKEYTVSTTIVPQLSSGSASSSLSSLASLAGFNLNSKGMEELSPIIYPQLVSSPGFLLDFIHQSELHYEGLDSTVSLYEYMTEVAKPSVVGTAKKYTIGLPFLLLNALRGEQKLYVPVAGGGEAGMSQVMSMSDEEAKIIKGIQASGMVSLVANSKEGYLTLTVKGPEPFVTAELAAKAQELLQRDIIRFKVEKSQAELDFVQSRYDEVKAEAEYYQEQVAKNTDKSKGIVNTASQLEVERLRNKYSISNSVYQELAKQLEQSKLQVKKDTPTFSVIKPVVVPTERTAPRRVQILAIWIFLGCAIGAGTVLAKSYLGLLKEKWEEAKA